MQKQDVQNQATQTLKTYNDYKDALTAEWYKYFTIDALSLSDDNAFKPKIQLQYTKEQLVEHIENNKRDKKKSIYSIVINSEIRVIDKDNYSRYFDSSKVTFDALYKDYLKLYKIAEQLIKDSQVDSTELSSLRDIENKVNRENARISERVVQCYKGSTKHVEYYESDFKYFYNRIKKDSEGNYYFVFEDKGRPSVEMIFEEKGKAKQILLDAKDGEQYNFWRKFGDYTKHLFPKWDDIILDVFKTYQIENYKVSFEEECVKRGVPRLYLECKEIVQSFVTYNYNSGEKQKTAIKHLHNTVRWIDTIKGRQLIHNEVETISKKLLLPIDIRVDVKKIKRFTNNQNELAIKYLHLPTYSNPSEEPQLPKNWSVFLEAGMDKNGEELPRFWNPKMDKMKIACYVVNTLSAEYDGRQATVLGGVGHDGKGTFIRVIRNILGEEHSVTVKAREYEDEHGLVGIVNKKAICLEEVRKPGTLFGVEQFLSVLGHDTVSLNPKHKSMINYNTKGTTTILATNQWFGLHGMETASRCMPLVFRRNYANEEGSPSKFISKTAMVEGLLAEKEEFLQWCVDYRIWLNEKYDRVLLSGGDEKNLGYNLKLMSDEDLENRAYNLYDDFELYKRALETMYLKENQLFVEATVDEDLDKDFDYSEELITSLFEKDEEVGMTAKEIQDRLNFILNSNKHKEIKKYIRKVFGSDIRNIREGDENIQEISFNSKNKNWRTFVTSLREVLKASRVKKRRGDKINWVYQIKIIKFPSEVNATTVADIEFKIEDFEVKKINDKEEIISSLYDIEEIPECWKKENWI